MRDQRSYRSRRMCKWRQKTRQHTCMKSLKSHYHQPIRLRHRQRYCLQQCTEISKSTSTSSIFISEVVLALYKTEEEVQECIVIKLYLMNKRMKKKESKGNDKMSSAWKWDKEREEGLYHQCSINKIKKRAIEQI
jgi:hypothetical protein